MNKNTRSIRTAVSTAVVILGIASTAFAGTLGNYQKVTLLQTSASTNNVHVSFDANLSSQPSCVSSSNHDKITFDATSARGKTQLALFQAAFLSNRLVRVTGTGTCTGGIENLNWVGFAD